MKRNQLILLCCSCLLAIAVFLPLINLPIVGSINYFMDGQGDGRYILILALISAALCFTRYSRWVVIPGTLSLVILTFFLLSYKEHVGRTGLLENSGMFGEFSKALTNTISISYGFVLMTLASTGLLLFPLVLNEKQN